jgi:hypothetical protein
MRVASSMCCLTIYEPAAIAADARLLHTQPQLSEALHHLDA